MARLWAAELDSELEEDSLSKSKDEMINVSDAAVWIDHVLNHVNLLGSAVGG